MQSNPEKPQNATSKSRSALECKHILWKLGIAEVALGGILCVVWIISALTAAGEAANSDPTDDADYHSDVGYGMALASPGLICGTLLFGTGKLGISTRNNRSISFYKANLAMSIISMVMMLFLVIISSAVAALVHISGAVRTLNFLLAILGLAGLAFCIVHCVYCCKVTCCRKKRQDMAGTHVDLQMVQPGRRGDLSGGQLKVKAMRSVGSSSAVSSSNDDGLESDSQLASGTTTKVTAI